MDAVCKTWCFMISRNIVSFSESFWKTFFLKHSICSVPRWRMCTGLSGWMRAKRTSNRVENIKCDKDSRKLRLKPPLGVFLRNSRMRCSTERYELSLDVTCFWEKKNKKNITNTMANHGGTLDARNEINFWISPLIWKWKIIQAQRRGSVPVTFPHISTHVF